jgi:dolichol-phosphate mannosyltransferase
MLSIVVPTYNERENISRLIAETLTHLPDAEVIVVDDDSPDRTSEEVMSGWGHEARVRLIRRVGERGLPSALVAGIRASRGEKVAWLDADFNMKPDVLRVLFDALDDVDVAVASRYVPGGEDARGERLRVWGSTAVNAVAQRVLGAAVRDYTSGHVAARREVFELVPLRGHYRYGDYCIDFLFRAHRAGLSIREIPYRCVDRQVGETKTSTTLGEFLSLGASYLRTILELRLHARQRNSSSPS